MKKLLLLFCIFQFIGNDILAQIQVNGQVDNAEFPYIEFVLQSRNPDELVLEDFQFFENSDGDKVEVDSMKFLHHKTDSISGESYLYTESNVSINAVWEFDVRLEFNSSSSNFAKVYLTDDDQNLTADLNGFFIQIGGTTESFKQVVVLSR